MTGVESQLIVKRMGDEDIEVEGIGIVVVLLPECLVCGFVGRRERIFGNSIVDVFCYEGIVCVFEFVEYLYEIGDYVVADYFFAGALTPTLHPPANKSTNVLMFCGNSGRICGSNLNLPPV